MKILKVIVDEVPEVCNYCPYVGFHFDQEEGKTIVKCHSLP